MNLDALKQTISDLSSQSKGQFEKATTQSELDDLYRSFLGKKGEVNLLLKSLGSLEPEKRKEAGKLLNILKSKRDEIVFKMKLTSKDEFDVLSKRVENLENKIKKLEIKKKNTKQVKKS